MPMTDPLADMLTRIRNAQRAGHRDVNVPSSRLKIDVAAVLKSEGYIQDVVKVEDKKQGILKITVKYGATREAVIREIKRVSKPGCRRYVAKDDIPRVLGGLGVAILSTSKGVMTDRKARELGVGGELLCTVY